MQQFALGLGQKAPLSLSFFLEVGLVFYAALELARKPVLLHVPVCVGGKTRTQLLECPTLG